MIDTQDIVFIKNINFKDNGKIDLKINGHPGLIIHTTEDNIYFLKISNHPPKSELEEEHYFIKDLGYINIKHIYKKERLEYSLYTTISTDLFNKIMDAFYFYQNYISEDEYFEELFKEPLTLTLKRNKYSN